MIFSKNGKFCTRLQSGPLFIHCLLCSSDRNQRQRRKETTTPGVPRRSPIQVLTGPDAAWLQWSDGNWYFQHGMVVAERMRQPGRFWFAYAISRHVRGSQIRIYFSKELDRIKSWKSGIRVEPESDHADRHLIQRRMSWIMNNKINIINKNNKVETEKIKLNNKIEFMLSHWFFWRENVKILHLSVTLPGKKQPTTTLKNVMSRESDLTQLWLRVESG